MKRLILLILVVAAGLVVAAFTVPAPALSVNGQTVSQDQLSSQLNAVSSSSAFQCMLGAEEAVSTDGSSGAFSTKGAGTGTYSSTFVGYWLSQLVTQKVVTQLVADRGLHVDPSEQAAARKDLLGSFEEELSEVEGSEYQCTEDPASFVASLPNELVDQQVRLEALDEVLLSHHSSGVSAAQIDAYYAAHTSSFDSLCVSGIIVASSADAEKVEYELGLGASFASAAAANSEDTSTAASGGALGCYSPSSSEYSSIKSAVGSLADGTPSQPIEQSDGYLILEKTGSTVSALSSVRSAVRAAVLEAATSKTNTVIKAATKAATVTVDPRYGRWTADSPSVGVLAPVSPPASTVLNASANVAS